MFIFFFLCGPSQLHNLGVHLQCRINPFFFWRPLTRFWHESYLIHSLVLFMNVFQQIKVVLKTLLFHRTVPKQPYSRCPKDLQVLLLKKCGSNISLASTILIQASKKILRDLIMDAGQDFYDEFATFGDSSEDSNLAEEVNNSIIWWDSWHEIPLAIRF